MKRIDVQSLRDVFIEQQILLCFNGPFSATLIEEIGHALRMHLESLQAPRPAVGDVFSAYIELTQNIRHYTTRKGLVGADAQATLVVSHGAEGGYVVSAGNVVETADGEILAASIDALNQLDAAALKAAYKTQLRQPRDPEAKTGAGLGLIDLARKAREPLKYTLVPLDAGRAFFSLHVAI